MYALKEKPIGNKSRVGNFVTQKKGNVKQGFVFVDNRHKVTMQRRVKDSCDIYKSIFGNVMQMYRKVNGGNKGGSFIGYADAIHCHIDIGNPHLKIGGNGNRYNFGQDMAQNRLQNAYERLLEEGNPQALGYEDCKKYLEELGCQLVEEEEQEEVVYENLPENWVNEQEEEENQDGVPPPWFRYGNGQPNNNLR